MSRAELVSLLMRLDMKLAMQALKNEQLEAKLKIAGLLKELGLQVQSKP